MTTTTEARAAIPHLLRAQDEKAIRERGPLGAIMSPKNEDTRVRRAALVLGNHWFGGERFEPADVMTALLMGRHLQRPVTK